ncbi:DUF2325 domain-containing protein [Desulfotalea psychrophila]|uniref:DUF2325 domain-containing protein n=1 Tax=Desulfotalea psychrophila (strain LSv54 / DSM 12343) TaxID=177439 RepID=Q6ARG3_DESPS|nr:DUF2325 domain-containing protein [Desulfotalea psychrophila]CAG35062.1 unknown protein [Desulfotalea psychrophila LSv54]
MASLKARRVQRCTGGKGRNLWDVPDGYQCAIIGTCITQPELVKINKKREVRGGEFVSPFELHTRFVRFAHYQCVASVAMQKLLNLKYQRYIISFHRLRESEDLCRLWQKSLEAGEVAGAFWAVCSHPHIPGAVLSECYGDVHMMSHDSVSELLRIKKKLASSLQKQKNVDAQLVHRQFLHEKRVRKEKQEVIALKAELKKREKKGSSASSAGGFPPAVKGVLERENEEHLLYIAKLEKHNGQLQKNAMRLEQEISQQRQENILLEKSVQASLFDLGCARCGRAHTESCPGKDLCGKLVLYVGGMHKMVPHYRALVEKSGGSFLHHDGGKEESKSRLPLMLAQADAVMCPVDCVSHDACLTVKKICKQCQKPYVMMRSSGLSSLAMGLGRLSS